MSQSARYSEQFKKDAVRLVKEEGYSVKKASDAVGVCHTTVRGWVAKYSDACKPRTRFASEADELEHLRRENRRLQMQCDILKKATAYFAREETL